MSSHDDLPQSRSWIARFAWWFLLSACLVVAATGIFLYVAARGTDVAMAQRRFYLGMTKWYIVDVHVVFGFLATGLAGVYALVWLVLRAPKAWLGQPQRLKRFACA
ncbi:MAG: hypothetical protein QG656_792, partial [Candidatus Hydrogenedentes bacterium]|nr:hypothetical protein [Candidatus Hydrogenedentota bacterium]